MKTKQKKRTYFTCTNHVASSNVAAALIFEVVVMWEVVDVGTDGCQRIGNPCRGYIVWLIKDSIVICMVIVVKLPYLVVMKTG